MTQVEVDPGALVSSADAFDDQARRCEALRDQLAVLMDPAVIAANPAVDVLETFAPTIAQCDGALQQVREFLTGTGAQVRVAGDAYHTTDEHLAAEAHDLDARMSAIED